MSYRRGMKTRHRQAVSIDALNILHHAPAVASALWKRMQAL
jgi:hypothetical protein